MQTIWQKSWDHSFTLWFSEYRKEPAWNEDKTSMRQGYLMTSGHVHIKPRPMVSLIARSCNIVKQLPLISHEMADQMPLLDHLHEYLYDRLL
jgi:hypothetical protein